MQTIGKRLLILVFLLAVIGACAVSVAIWRIWAGSGPAAPLDGVPVLEGGGLPTPTLAAAGDNPDSLRPNSAEAGPELATPPAEAVSDNALSGTFEGTVRGDGGSSALLRLELVQNGRDVAGVATIGEGLQIDAGGFCGSFPVPAMQLQTREQLDSAGSHHLSTTSNVEVEGFEIPVVLEATLSADGQTVTAAATLETPALCANDPTLRGTLTRIGG